MVEDVAVGAEIPRGLWSLEDVVLVGVETWRNAVVVVVLVDAEAEAVVVVTWRNAVVPVVVVVPVDVETWRNPVDVVVQGDVVVGVEAWQSAVVGVAVAAVVVVAAATNRQMRVIAVTDRW